ncbi:retrotransposon protein, putative, ty1-copia subclass [Tanacetum coccineum]
MTTTAVNNSLFRSLFEKQKLTGNNFLEWYRNHRIVLSTEDKLPFLEHPIRVLPVPPQGQANPPDVVTTHQAWVKEHKEIDGLMIMTMDLEIQKTLEHLGAYDMLKELKTLYVQQADQELLQTVREFHACKQEERQSVSSYVLKMKSYIDNLERLGHAVTQNLYVSLILVSLRKEYEGFVQNYNMHSMRKTVNKLHAILKLHEQTLPPKEVAPALHAIRAGRVQKNQKKKSHKVGKANQGKGKAKMGYAPVQAPHFAPNPKNPLTPKKDNPAKDAICHQCGEHCRLRHINKKRIEKLQHDVHLDSTDIKSIEKRVACMSGKMARKPYSHQVERAKDLFRLIHTDVCGPFKIMSRQGAYYFVTFTDDFSRYGYVYLLKHKHEVFETFKVFQKEVENQLGKTIKSLRSDRGGEYMSQEFLNHLKDHGIIAHRTPPYTPQHNGVSERRNRTLLDMVRSMMSQTTLPKSFWDYALESAARILNMVPTKKVDKTPYEVWHGQAPKLSYLKVWGCEALVKRDTLTKPDKLEPRALKCIFVGYPKETMGYSFYYPPENKVFVARNAEFFENEVIDHEASGSLEDLEIIQEEDTHPSLDTSLNHEEDDQEIDEPQSDINPIRRSTRTRCPTDRLCLYVDAEEHELGDLGEPANYKAALLDPESDKWLNAMNVEMQSMKDNEVLKLVDLPPNGKTVGHKWLFKKKTDMDGAVHTYKARLVAKGFTQTPGIYYEETFSPVADIRAIRILIAIAAFYYYEIWQIDVKTASLNGYLNEEVYIEQPEGFVSQKYPNRVCKLKRSIYGLKQASRQWNKRFDDEIKKFRFSQNRDEPCVYVKASGSYVTFLILYVDDILIMGNNIPMLQDVKSYLGRCFAMKDLGEAAYILGIKIYRDRSKRLIGLCQSAYIKKILKRFYMENSKRGTIPMQEKLKLSKSQGASTPAKIQRMQNISYASAVGSIMYAVRCTRPEVAFAYNITSRFQQNPSDAHWTAVKNIMKIFAILRICFLFTETGYVFVLNGGVVYWKSTKQKPINMYCDNTGAIAKAKDHGITKGARHFREKVHYLRETIKMGDVKIDKVDTDDNIADPFTKALAFPKHSELTEKIEMIPASSLM